MRTFAGLAVILVSLAAPSAGSADSRGTMAPATQLQSALLDQVNALRTAHGLTRLRLSAKLTAAANAHSTEMARLGYFSHNSANGASFSSRIGQFYPLRGFHSWTVGENLVWGAPEIGALRAFKLWLGSPPHRANLLSSRWPTTAVPFPFRAPVAQRKSNGLLSRRSQVRILPGASKERCGVARHHLGSKRPAACPTPALDVVAGPRPPFTVLVNPR